MRRYWLAIGLAVAALMVGAVACSSSKTPSSGGQTQTGSAQSEVTVNLTEYLVAPKPASVPAGSVTFDAKNIGGTDHELVVIKTSLSPDALPTKADGSVDEKGAGITIVDKTSSVPAKQEKSITDNLAAGSYVLICNLVQTVNGQTISHYAQGMRTKFTVKQ